MACSSQAKEAQEAENDNNLTTYAKLINELKVILIYTGIYFKKLKKSDSTASKFHHTIDFCYDRMYIQLSRQMFQLSRSAQFHLPAGEIFDDL